MVEHTNPELSKYITYGDKSAQDFENRVHTAISKEAASDPATFFDKKASDVHWFKKYTKAIDMSDKYLHRWFPDGLINLTYNCVDRHVEAGRGSDVAFYADSAYTNEKSQWTYKQVQEQTGRLASVMIKKFGVKTGDRVLIYMPMVIEAAFAMLACARIGAIHSVVFGGFAAKELANRIDDCEPKVIITASAGIEPSKTIPYVPILESALDHCKLSGVKNIPLLIKQRKE